MADAQAQRPAMGLQADELPVQEQPGLVPDPEEERLPAAYQRQLVYFRSAEPPGTIVVHTSERFLYLVLGNNRAVRYGIGVGRDGFQWAGLLRISRKSEWPDWIPPPEMIERQPYLPRFMAGGESNPLTPSSIRSSRLPIPLATTARPAAIYSYTFSGEK